MIVGAFGDSFLFGSDLSDIQDIDSKQWFFSSKLTYSALIAKKLQAEYYCTALPAQGNKVISDDIVRAISYHGNKMFYIINWTWIDRYEYIAQTKVGTEGWHSTLPVDNGYESQYFYKHFYNDLDAKLSNLMYIYTALNCLLDNRCQFLMTYMDHLLFDKQFYCPASVDLLQNTIQKYTSTYKGKNFLEWSKEQELPISEAWHPLEESHQKAAEYWMPTIKTLLNTHAKEDYLHAFK